MTDKKPAPAEDIARTHAADDRPHVAPDAMVAEVGPLALEDEGEWAAEVEEQIRRDNPELAKALDRIARVAGAKKTR